MEHILNALVAILIRPETSTAMEHEALNNYCNYPWRYNYMAKESAKKATKVYKS